MNAMGVGCCKEAYYKKHNLDYAAHIRMGTCETSLNNTSPSRTHLRKDATSKASQNYMQYYQGGVGN